MPRRKRRDPLLAKLEKEIMDILAKPHLTEEDALRLKALETGAKLLTIRHRIGGEDDTSFFGGGAKSRS